MTTALRDLGYPDAELSILFTDDKEIAALNERYLGRKGPTNVLAFPASEGSGPDVTTGLLGDIVISVDRALEEAKTAGEPMAEACDRLLVHGLLHLLGYDHEHSTEEAQEMFREEERLLSMIREV